jgi:single-strand DNA-binding protein
MARSVAEATIRGNNVVDVELKYTNSGSAMLRLRIAVERWRRKGEEWEKTNQSFFNVVLWGDLAESTAEIIEKGQRIEVKGHLEERQWETDAGEKRYATQLVGREVSIPHEDIETMTRKRRGKGSEGETSAPIVGTLAADKAQAPASNPFDEELDF